ncbi:unnamed protein product [Mytilus coruscus]|uniref:Tc1-like transposase DDE domain-containing protein n=1 Tax=Mytilus coruscus TaxID=42192 RepID=A0A6J8BXG6_MYTCO|nr:unnamed protein product [Mytilus coruscus]
MAERKRILSSHSKEIVYNVSKFFESQIQQPTATPVKAFTERTAEATLVSKATIRRVRREKNEKGRLFHQKGRKQKIHEFYTVRRQLPTIDRLYESIKCDINFPGSKSLLLKIVKELGFKWKRSQTKRKVLIEKDAIVEKRIKYLHRIKDYREKDMNLVYIDETWIDTAYTAKKCWQHEDECFRTSKPRTTSYHRSWGGKFGFVPNALLIYKAKSCTGDYHHEMNGENLKKWFTEKLLCSLPEKSVIIMDNASYYSVQFNKCPTTNTKKADIQAWLRSHKIQFDNKLLHPQLLALAKASKQTPKYVIDNIARERGHDI